jgi:sugar lactone lactonase YvrE
MPELSVLADYGDLCGEGPLWDRRTNTLYWTDINGKCFYRLNWSTREHERIQSGFEVAGYAFQEPDGFVVVNAQGIWQWDGEDEPRLSITEADGTKCQMNDCIADPQGRLFAGSWFYDPAREDYPVWPKYSADALV